MFLDIFQVGDVVRDEKKLPRWWFQIFFMFIPIWGFMIQFDVCMFFRWVGKTTNKLTFFLG